MGFKKNNPGCDCCARDCVWCDAGTGPQSVDLTFANVVEPGGGCGSCDNGLFGSRISNCRCFDLGRGVRFFFGNMHSYPGLAMICDFDITREAEHWLHECRRCGRPQRRPIKSDAPPNVVRQCDESVPRGVGDSVAKFTAALGIKPCGGCETRRKWLNGLLPYKSR